MVGDTLQDVHCVYWKELYLELGFKVSPGLDGKESGICFLVEEVLRPLCCVTAFEEGESP